ncbi:MULTISPECIES: hypothetical protein [unclassified Sphingomonas]|uniref:hypothetical protein n=1 Tax=unclassified Sphingomonas TaxID=196159 RepID=UPI0012E2246F|nr:MULTISPECIES: hypothetical protein [unclassified Sphingomonas]
MAQPKASDLASIADYPALQPLARSLWKSAGLRGAAVLIGAGFSREAILTSPDTPPPPLWKDLADAMTHDLYPGREEMAPWDPLRLAEEYRAYFGQSALDAFIRHHIRDGSWNPSASHARLLSLPWADGRHARYLYPETFEGGAALDQSQFFTSTIMNVRSCQRCRISAPKQSVKFAPQSHTLGR